MNKTAINKMLDIITERKPSLRESYQYNYMSTEELAKVMATL